MSEEAHEEHVKIINTEFHMEWKTFEKPENKRQMYGSQAWDIVSSQSARGICQFIIF